MKKFLISLVITIMTVCIAYPQNYVVQGNTFSVEKTVNIKTPYTWKDKDGQIYPIYMTKKGSYYIKRISKKTGKEYKYYLPKEVQEQIRNGQKNIN